MFRASNNNPENLPERFFQDILVSIMAFDKNLSYCIFKAAAAPPVFASGSGSATTSLIEVTIAAAPLLYTSNSGRDRDDAV